MKPSLKIGPLINLQDARYSAAAGFDVVSFSLERGSDRKLSVSMIWNMVQWLSGPEIALEMNVASLEELSEANDTFSYHWITLPAAEWDERVWQHTPAGVVLRADAGFDPDHLAGMLLQAKDAGREMRIELFSDAAGNFLPYDDFAGHCFLHFPSLDALGAAIPFLKIAPMGFALGLEAEEEPGVLHYERIDELLEQAGYA